MVKKREEIVSKKEAILNEKSELEMKKLRSSQVINKVSNQLKVFKCLILASFLDKNEEHVCCLVTVQYLTGNNFQQV